MYIISLRYLQTVTSPDPVDAGGLEAGFSSAKKQILLTLKRQGSVSLGDLATGLAISKMATLKHLSALEGKGLVERSSRAGGRGRPRAFFALTRNASTLFPEAYTHMTLSALRFIEEKLGRDAVVRLLEQRAQEVLDANRGRMPDGGLKEKVGELVKIRDEGGYMAELGHSGKNVIEMMEHNCPIMAVAETYPEACGVERELFQKLLRADVETSHRVVAGDPVCRFLIRHRRGTSD
ncbi:MAG: transcriptional regulator [Methanobacteriota archaeon]|nr:MAG: transcriptional regulator [Euryarchaeota archaeon]